MKIKHVVAAVAAQVLLLVVFLSLTIPACQAMAGLVEHTTPAERERGCSLAEGFESQAAVEAAGWTVHGAPTFDARDGVTLDGTSDYLTKPLTGSEFDSAALSIVVEFTPGFALGSGGTKYFFGTGGVTDTYLRFNSDATTMVLTISGTVIAPAALGSYQSAWDSGGRNVIVVSGTSGDTSMWINGTKVIDGDASAWSSPGTSISDIAVCATTSGNNNMAATIHRLQVYKTQLEDQEALDICSGNTYRYMDDATLILTGDMDSHDPTNHRILDRSGHGNHVTLGDGAGSDEPTKLAVAGYEFTGSEYAVKDDAAFDPSGDFTAAILCSLDDTTTAQHVLVARYSGTAGWGIYNNNDDDVAVFVRNSAGITQLNHNDVLTAGPVYFVGLSYKYIGAANSVLRAYVDGINPTETAVAKGPVGAAPGSPLTLGAWSSPHGAYLDGRIFGFVFLDGVRLTPLQMLDLEHRMRSWARRP